MCNSAVEFIVESYNEEEVGFLKRNVVLWCKIHFIVSVLYVKQFYLIELDIDIFLIMT